MTKQHNLLLGAHMSISGGFEQALIRGQSIGCTAVQFFTKGNRQWHAKPIDKAAADLYLATLEKSSIKIVVAHAMYLLNIGSPDRKIWHGSISALAEELERCHTLEIPYLVIHPGARIDQPLKDCLGRISTAINRVFEKTQGKTMLLLENMAGAGSQVCSNFEEIAEVIDGIEHKKRIGVCIDTCHAFAAGYDFTHTELYKAFWKKFDDIVGKHYLKAIHLNDSKKELNSHVDRHEEIGMGKIGMEAFSLLMNDPHLFDIPKILETPESDLKHYEKNMNILIETLSSENKKKLF